MIRFDEATSLIRRLAEPEQRELLAWLTDSLDDSWRVAEAAPRYGVTTESQETFTVEEYLALEESSSDQHEYVAGHIYAMSEPLEPHKLISGNVFAALHGHLRGTPCRPYIHSTQVHIRARGEDYFYYPDILVTRGQARDEKGRFIEHRLVMEVMSRSTERIDRREKAFTYRDLPSIEEIVLISQKSTFVTVYRRAEDWAPVILTSLEEQALELKSISLALPLRQIYEGLP